MKSLLLVFVSVIAIANGHVFRLGDCPKVEVQKDFEMKKVINAAIRAQLAQLVTQLNVLVYRN